MSTPTDATPEWARISGKTPDEDHADALALELANARAHFAALSAEWNRLNDLDDVEVEKEPSGAFHDCALALRACGQRVERLERQANGPAVPEYGAESGVI